MKILNGLLEQINIYPHRSLRNNHAGDFSRNVKGHSNDFLKYEKYKIGDNINKIDWKKYCKSRELLSRQFGEENNYKVVIAVDTSKSMDFGSPLKSSYQKDLIEAMTYSFLYHHHPVILFDMSTFDYIEIFQPMEQGLAFASKWLEIRKYEEIVKFSNESIYSLFGNSLTICITDGWFEGYDKFIDYQFSIKNDLIMLQIITEEEMNPKVGRNSILIDSESGEKVAIDFTEDKVVEYNNILKEILSEKKKLLDKYGYRYFRCVSGESLNNLLITLGR